MATWQGFLAQHGLSQGVLLAEKSAGNAGAGEGPDGAEARRAESALGRRLRERALEALTQRGTADGPLARVSVTHTAGWSLCCAAGGAPALQGVGVDLERADREVDPRTVARVSSAEELALGLAPLQLWTLKEAAFKADPGNAGKVLANYQVRRAGQGYEAHGPQGRRIALAGACHDGWWVAFALVLA